MKAKQAFLGTVAAFTVSFWAAHFSVGSDIYVWWVFLSIGSGLLTLIGAVAALVSFVDGD